MKIDKEKCLDKLDNFWYHYKWYVICGMTFFLITFSLAKEYLSQKDIVFSADLVNFSITGLDEFKQEYLNSSGIDQNNESITLDILSFGTEQASDSIYSFQTVQAQVAAHTLDAIISDKTSAEKYMLDLFEDIRDCLSEENMQELENRILYYDVADEEQLLSHDASDMAEPIPVAILVSGDSKLAPYMEGGFEYVFGFSVNSENRENAIRFLYFILE